MSIGSATSRNAYTGNSSVSTYAYGYRIFSDSDLLVTVRNTDDAETTLVLNTDYTVTGAGDAAGGNILLVNAGQAWLTAGKLTQDFDLVIRRVRPVTQETDIRNQGDFYPETHEDAFDHGVMLAQQQQDAIDRSVKLPETIPSTDFDPTLPADIMSAGADTVLKVNAAGDGFEIGPSADAIDTAAASAAFIMATSPMKKDTYANLKALALASPTVAFIAICTDIKQVVCFTADLTMGNAGDGFVVLGG